MGPVMPEGRAAVEQRCLHKSEQLGLGAPYKCQFSSLPKSQAPRL